MQPEARRVSCTKRQALSKMVKCASDLGAEQKEQLLQLLIEFADIFADEGELGHTDRITHNINTGSAPLIRQPVRSVPEGGTQRPACRRGEGCSSTIQ